MTILIPPHLYREAWELAKAFERPTIYDTTYLVVARLLGCEFWTGDRKLVNALMGQFPWARGIWDWKK